MFFGPASVASMMAVAIDDSKGKLERTMKALLGTMMGFGLVYAVLIFVLFAAGVDVWCDGWIGSYTCGYWDPCEHGHVFAGSCRFARKTKVFSRESIAIFRTQRPTQ
eukprot:COSAG06_NODE_17752_length_923_cov_1.148058_1_plen_107_part_00